MPTYAAVVHLACISGLPRDDSEITLHYEIATAPTDSDFASLAAVISNFFNTSGSGMTLPVKAYLSRDRDYGTNACRVDFYLIPSTPGPLFSPVSTKHFTLGTPFTGAVSLPQQDAVCLSYNADLAGVPERSGSTRPAARKRGRVFIGPLNDQTFQLSGSGTAAQTVRAQFQVDLGKAASLYLKTQAAGVNWVWVVFSRTAWTQAAVLKGYVNDRFDTQRRRLQTTTGRTVWT